MSQVIRELISRRLSFLGLNDKQQIPLKPIREKYFPESFENHIKNDDIILSSKNRYCALNPDLMKKYPASSFDIDNITWELVIKAEELRFYIAKILYLDTTKKIDIDDVFDKAIKKWKHLVTNFQDNDIDLFLSINRNYLYSGWTSDMMHIYSQVIHKAYIDHNIRLRSSLDSLLANRRIAYLFGNGINFKICESDREKYENKNILGMVNSRILLDSQLIDKEENKFSISYMKSLLAWINYYIRILTFDSIISLIKDEINRETPDILIEYHDQWYSIFSEWAIETKIMNCEYLTLLDIGIETYSKIENLKQRLFSENHSFHEIDKYIKKFYKKKSAYKKSVGAAIYLISKNSKPSSAIIETSSIMTQIFTTNYDLNLEKSLSDNGVKHLHGELRRFRKNFTIKYSSEDKEIKKLLKSGYSFDIIIGSSGYEKEHIINIYGSNENLLQFKEALGEYDVLMICGYSGDNDSHINNLIRDKKSDIDIIFVVYELDKMSVDKINTLKNKLMLKFLLPSHEIGNRETIDPYDLRFQRKLHIIDTNLFYANIFTVSK